MTTRHATPIATANCSVCDGTGEVPRAPKFTSLVSTSGGLMGLAEDGSVWVYCRNPREGWKPLGMSRLANEG